MKCRREIKQTLFTALLVGCLFSRQILMVVRASEPDNEYAQEVFALLEDSQYTGTITLQQDINPGEEYRYGFDVKGPENCEKTLDLNGHTITLTNGSIDNWANFCLTDSMGGGKLVLARLPLTNYRTIKISGVSLEGGDSNVVISNMPSGSVHLVSGTVDALHQQFAIENNGGICVIDGGEIHSRYTAIVSRFGNESYGISGQDEFGRWYGTTGYRWYDGNLTINGGLIGGDLELYDTDVTITGGVVRGQIEMVRHNEYKDGHSIKLETPQEMQYYNAAGDTITLPKPTYELHEDNGEMKRGYWDVPMNAWFYAPVQALMDDRVLDYGGYDDKGNFGPTEPLTRGQAAALLVRACGAEVAEEATEPPFLDVTDATPYAKYINAGKKLGLLSGDGQGQFYPESTITRQEFAVLVMNAVHKYGLELPPEAPGVAFQDEDAIAPWAVDAVAEGAGYGLWNGTGSGDFLPLAPIARAEGATILARLMKVIDINPNEI